MTALLILLFVFCHAGIGAVLLAAVELRRRWRAAKRLTAGRADQHVAQRAARHRVDNVVPMRAIRKVERPQAPATRRHLDLPSLAGSVAR